jgi:hypothetical protein
MPSRQTGFSLIEITGAIVVMTLAIGIAVSVQSRSAAAERELAAIHVLQSAAQAVRAAHPFHAYDRVDARTLSAAAGFADLPFDASVNGYRINDIGVLSALPVLDGELPVGFAANTAFELRLALGRNPSLCTSLTMAFKSQARRVYAVSRGTPFVLADNTVPGGLPQGMSGVSSVCRAGGVELWLTFA